MSLPTEKTQEKSPEPCCDSKTLTGQCSKHEFSVVWCSWHDNTLTIRGYHGRQPALMELEGAKLPQQGINIPQSNLIRV